MATGVPAQRPLESQTSDTVQGFPSLQLEPAGTWTWETTPVLVLQESTVQGLPSLTLTGVPAHWPELPITSFTVQALPSLQGIGPPMHSQGSQ
jgi:hypothetical protein